MGSEKAFLRVRVTGNVQGVGYRFFTERVAAEIGLVGYVMNRRDGSVEVVAEGNPEALRQFLRRLQQGPPGARVQGVEETWESSTGRFSEFGIRFEE